MVLMLRKMALDFKNIIFIPGLFCLFAFSGCTQPNLPPPEITWLNQHIKNEYFSIDVPWGWRTYVSRSRNGNLHYDFLDPHYAKFRVRITITKDVASLSGESDDVSIWGRICLLFSDLFTPNYAVRSRDNLRTKINGKVTTIEAVNTDEFSGYIANISGEEASYIVYYWLWKDFPQETKDRIRQIVYSMNVP